VGLGNSYRFIQKINDTLDGIYNIFNDNLNNGKFNQRPLNNGTEKISVKLFDSISVEMQCISPAAHLYFYSLSQQSGAGPGGGTAPSNPPNNIIGGALGLFSAHTSQTKVIKILNK
jgi:H+/Cl- antiporter ClcA